MFCADQLKRAKHFFLRKEADFTILFLAYCFHVRSQQQDNQMYLII